MNAKFQRHQRVSKKEDFERIFAKGRKIKQKFLTIRALDNHLDYPRLGIIIPKAVVQKSVNRNRIRRIIRESFRAQQSHLKSLDIVVLVHSQCVPANKQLLRKEIENLWHPLSSGYKHY